MNRLTGSKRTMRSRQGSRLVLDGLRVRAGREVSE
jgi:hypothetical protein